MKTINEWLEILKTDGDLQNSIEKYLYINPDIDMSYTGKTRKNFKLFWSGIEGAQFRLDCERKHNLNTGNKQEISKLKDALVLFMSEVSKDA
ncbi:MAG: hypothetical protein ACYCWE_09710 [Eubacteriales bacterium]